MLSWEINLSGGFWVRGLLMLRGIYELMIGVGGAMCCMCRDNAKSAVSLGEVFL